MSEQVHPTVARLHRWAARLDRLPRMLRVLLSLLITLELVILASVIIDRTLLDNVIEGSMDAMTPALIAAALGLVFYGIGWWAMVGFDADPNRPWHAGLPAVIYAGLGLAGLLVTLILVIAGLLFGYVL